MKQVTSSTHSYRYIHLASYLLIGILLMVLAGCTTSPPNVPAHKTVTPTVFSWETLQQKPLHLPTIKSGASCPVTNSRSVAPQISKFFLGNGPIYAVFFGGNLSTQKQSILQYADAPTFGGGISDGWGGQKVLWFIDPTYHGPALIRGKQLDGAGQVRFDSEPNEPGMPDAHTLLPAMRVMGGGAGAPWRTGLQTLAFKCQDATLTRWMALGLVMLSFSKQYLFTSR